MKSRLLLPLAIAATSLVAVFAVPMGSGAEDARFKQCADGIDNDGNGLIDYPADPGCDSRHDRYEEPKVVDPPPPPPQCSNGINDDPAEDSLVDMADPGCSSPTDTTESPNPVVPPPAACADGVDNDGDGLIDLNDPGCSSSSDTDETNVVEPPPPTGLPFAEASLSNPTVITEAQLAADDETLSFSCATCDYLVDLHMQPRDTLVVSGQARNIQFRNLNFNVTDPILAGESGYWRSGLALQVLANHISVTNIFVRGTAGLTDAVAIAAKPTTKFTMQRFLLEAPADSQEPAAHLDDFQIQGAIGRVELGIGTAFIAGVRPPNHAGKGLQLAFEEGVLGQTPGPFTVDVRQVDFEGLGTPATGARSQMAVLQEFRSIDVTFTDVFYAQAPGLTASFCHIVWPYLRESTDLGVCTGTAPNRVLSWATKPDAGLNGLFKERAVGTHYVTRAMLGVS